MYEFKSKQQDPNAMTKIAIKTQSATYLIAHGGAAVVDGLLRPFSIDSLIDQKLGLRGKTIAAFKYSEIFRSVLYTTLCGGEHLEDVSLNTVGCTLRAILPDVPSPDTTSRGLRSLAVEATMYVDERTGHEYLFSVNKQMNELMLKMQIRLGQLKEGENIDVVDFDHVFLPNEKEYAKPSYKKKTGEFPGVAMTNQRAESEKNFDIQNNDFCWSMLPFRKMKENNVFLIVMAMIKNIYLYLIARIATVMPHLDVRNRLRRFIFEFMTVPAKLTSHSGLNVLTQLFALYQSVHYFNKFVMGFADLRYITKDSIFCGDWSN